MASDERRKAAEVDLAHIDDAVQNEVNAMQASGLKKQKQKIVSFVRGKLKRANSNSNLMVRILFVLK